MLISEILTHIKAADVDTKLQYHDTLNPKFWDDRDQLIPDVRKHMLDIAEQYRIFLNLPKDSVHDIIFTGSNANYNWTSLSDVDVHVVADLSHLQSDYLEDYLKAKKDLWNSKHKITIHGYDVELYAQDEDEKIKAGGIYSLIDDEWKVHPVMRQPSFDEFSVRTKSASIMDSINSIEDKGSDALDKALELKEKIKKMRKSGLEKGGEFSTEALVFKVLRNNGYLDKLSELILKLQDERLSLT